jgi:RNA polymerase sigma-70 factor, ECF subfamily
MAVKSKRWATSTAEKTLRAVEGKKDERLLVDAARQDPARFAELYDNNFERVYAYVARRVRDRDEAEDVTSEVFREALASLHRFEWRGLPFVAWLLRIASNVLSDRWRRLSMAHEIGPDDVEQIGVDDDIEQRAILYQLVETLPDDQRRVIILRFAGQKSLREIAIVLERSEGAIKQLQLRALQNLRERIRSNHG